MTHFQRLINDGVLIDANYDPNQLKNAFSEVLSLFEDHQNRILKLETNSVLHFTKKEAKKLSDRVTELEKGHETFPKFITKNMQTDKEELLKHMNSLKEWVEEQNSSILVDVRRFINSELEAYVLKTDLLNEKSPSNTNNNEVIISRDVPTNYVDPRENSRLASKLADLQERVEFLESKEKTFATTSYVQDLLQNLEIPTELPTENNNKVNTSPLEADIEEIKERLRMLESTPQIKQTKPTISLKEAESSNASVTNFIKTPSMSIFSLSSTSTPQHNKLFATPEPPSTPLKPASPSAPMQSPVILGADTADFDRAIRKQNENFVNVRQQIAALSDKITELEQKHNSFTQSVGMKHLEISQTLDQLSNQLARAVQTIIKDPAMKELVAPLSRKIQVIEGRLTEVENRKMTKGPMFYDESLPTKPKSISDESPIPSQTPTPEEMLEEARASGQVTSFSTPIQSKQNSLKDLESPPDKGYEFSPITDTPSKRSTTKIKNIKHNDKNSEQLMEALQKANSIPTISQDEIQEKVNEAIRKTLSGFSDRVRKAVKEDVDEQLKVITKVQAQIETKIDRDFVERMFNKFRVLVNELKERVDGYQLNFEDWITREELEEVLTRFSQSLHEIKDTAGASSKYRCLLCGRPRTHIAGMMLVSPREEEDSIDQEKNETRPKTSTKTRKGQKSIRRPVSHAMPRDVVQLLTGKDSRR